MKGKCDKYPYKSHEHVKINLINNPATKEMLQMIHSEKSQDRKRNDCKG